MTITILQGDCRNILKTLPDESVHCCVTSPPYFGLRDYGVDGQIGREPTPENYVDALVGVFREVRRVLRSDGTLWLNLGDSYANDGKWGGASGNKNYTSAAGGYSRERKHTGLKAKDLIGLPWMVAFALRADGWYLRSDIIWNKPNGMPESVTDRPTRIHEYLFLLSKSEYYYYDADAIAEPVTAGYNGSTFTKGKTQAARAPLSPVGQRERVERSTRNKRSVWTVATQAYPGSHFATFPPALIEPCILAGCPIGGMVLDPFGGTCTTARVAEQHGRDSVMIELNPDYIELAEDRTDKVQVRMPL